MKQSKIFSALFIISIPLILVSLIYPIKYHYADKKIPEIPVYNSYDTALIRDLPQAVAKSAELQNCKGYIVPVTLLDEPAEKLDGLQNDINLALASYGKWQLLVDERIRNEMKARTEKRLHDFGALLTGDQLMNLAFSQKGVAFTTNYSASAKLARLTGKDSPSGDDARLVVTVSDELHQARLFETVVTFALPSTVRKWSANRTSAENKLNDLKNKADFSQKMFFASVAFFLILIVAFSAFAFIGNIRNKRMKSFLLTEIEKRESLITDGHFVAALELADKYLKYFPDDTDIKAFRERLLDFTGNNVKKAQIAYVEAKKMRLRLEAYGKGDNTRVTLLAQDEKKWLNELAAFHPELKNLYGQALLIEENQRKEELLLPHLKRVRGLIDNGKLNEAGSLFEELSNQYSDHPDFKALTASCVSQREKALSDIDLCKRTMAEGEILKAVEHLNCAKKLHSDNQSIIGMEQAITEAKGIVAVNLRKTDSSNEMNFVFGESAVFGRNDAENTPDFAVEDRRISRRHARITVKNETIVVEDLGSTAGTFVDGAQVVNTAEIHDGQTLTLAKVIDLKIHTFRETPTSRISGVMLRRNEKTFFIIPSQISFELSGGIPEISRQGISFFRKDGFVWAAENDRPILLKHRGETIIDGSAFQTEVKK